MKTISNMMGWLQRIIHRYQNANSYTKTLYTFNALSLVGGTTYGLYYGVFLYKHTFSLSVLAIDGLLGGVGVWFGYLLGVRLIQRAGYNRTVRGAFILWALISFSTALIVDHIAAWFMAIAIVKAIPSGMYAAVGDTIMLRNVATKSRGGFLQLNLALEFIGSIVLPSAVGALITATGGYRWAFVAAGMVYLLSFALRCKLPRPDVVFDARAVLQLFKRPLYPVHALNRTVAAGFNQLNAFAITILPFLLLGSELSMGLIASGSAIVAVVVSLWMRRLRSARHQIKLGYGAHAAKFVVSGLFVTAWTAPVMAVWQVVGKVLTPLHDPVQQSLDIHNDSLILGKEAQQSALQINVMNNTLKLIGSTLAFGAFIMLTRANPAQQRAVLEGIIVSYALWRMVSLLVTVWINRLAQRLEDQVPLRWVLRDKLTALSYVWYVRFGKLQALFVRA